MIEQKQRYEVATFCNWNANLDYVLTAVEETINEWLKESPEIRIISTVSNMSPPYQHGNLNEQAFAYTVIITFEYVEETPQQNGIDAALEATRRHIGNMETERNRAMGPDSKIAFSGAISSLKELYSIIEKLK